MIKNKKEVLVKLLIENNMFSKCDHDMGCMSLIQHYINTGDAASIRQLPGRIAPACRKEMEDVVCQLAE